MKGQTVVEYVIIIGIIVTAMYVMGPAFKRGVQTLVKGTADQLSSQKLAEQDFSTDTSHMESSRANVSTNNQRSIRQDGTKTIVTANESSTTTINTVTEMGFSPI